MDSVKLLSKFHENCCEDTKIHALSFLCSEYILDLPEYKEMGEIVIRNEVRWLFTVENKKIIDGIVKKALMLKAEKHIEEYKKSRNGYKSEKKGKYEIDAELKNLKEIFKGLWRDFKYYNNDCEDKDIKLENLETDRFDNKMISHTEILKNFKIISECCYNSVIGRIAIKIVPNWMYRGDESDRIVKKYLEEDNAELNKIKQFSFGRTRFQKKLTLLKMPPNISKLKKLETLWCEEGNLMKLPPWIGGFRFLTNLNLSYNRIEEIHSNIGNLKNLEWCSLTGNYIKKLPDSMKNLINLKFINICENPFERLPLVFMSLGLEKVRIQIEKGKLRGLEYREEGWTRNKKGEECVTVSPKTIEIEVKGAKKRK